MAATSSASEKTEKFGFAAFDAAATQAAWGPWKELFSNQFKATQAAFEHGFGLVKKGTDVFTSQLAEGLKFQQEAFKFGTTLAETGLHVAESVRKTAFETTEKAIR